MSSNYDGLADKIIDANDAARDFMCSCYDRGVEAALEYFDNHPDQVPGRTITESEYNRAVLVGDSFTERLELLGFEIVPDPKPTIPIPTEPGARFIAYSPKWSDGAEDQREFIVAGPYLVRLDDGALFNRNVFGEDWTVTSIVKAPEAGGDDD